MTTASSPGKILLAGEYAVLEGGAAVVMAVNRRARAWIAPSPFLAAPAAPSPFLAAAAAVLAAELGADSAPARAAAAVRADTDALRAPSGDKLGLGSSAAATAAALAACLATAGPLDRALLHRLAHRAHGDAQAALDPAARGSGADIAASVWGGVLALEPVAGGDLPPTVSHLTLPAGLELVPVWTGRPADTRVLVAAIRALAARDPIANRRCLDAVAAAAADLAGACRAGDARRAVGAVAAGGQAVLELGRAAGVDLFLEAHRALSLSATARGGALKPTGAGGGDIALGAFDDPDRAQQFRADAARLGMTALDLRVEQRGAALDDDSA
jgi:phosphomevalonate kinase